MHLTFVNGYERQYNMAASPFSNIEFELKHINKMIEYERNCLGQDDELEDDQ